LPSLQDKERERIYFSKLHFFKLKVFATLLHLQKKGLTLHQNFIIIKIYFK